MLPTGLLYELQDRFPADHAVHRAAQGALSGDPTAAEVMRDLLEENGLMDSIFKVGETYLIQTVTLYMVGRVTAVHFGWIDLEHASWVHWTGRLSVLCRLKKFTGREFGDRKPRTEYVGNYHVFTHSIVGVPSPGGWHLPEGPIE
jgi:hypothetical protein